MSLFLKKKNNVKENTDNSMTAIPGINIKGVRNSKYKKKLFLIESII